MKRKLLVNSVLTSIVMGYNLKDTFTGHHMMPDVPVTHNKDSIIKWGKEAHAVVNSKHVAGQSVRGVSISYSGTDYKLNKRILNAEVHEENLEESKRANLELEAQTVKVVYRKLMLEGEQDKALLANNPDHYAANNKLALSGTDLWSNPTADIATQVKDAKLSIVRKTGQNANVFHIDVEGYVSLTRNENILKHFKGHQSAVITLDMLASYFDVSKVVVGRSLYTPEEDGDFDFIWKNNSQLVYVPEAKVRDRGEPSFGYNYVKKGRPLVEKNYFDKDTLTQKTPVRFEDIPIITDDGAGFLFQNTSG